MPTPIEPIIRRRPALVAAAAVCAAATALMAICGGAAADTDGPVSTGAQTSAIQDPIRTSLEGQSEHVIKRLYRNCNREALEGRLASGEIALCTVVYEVLLAKHFAGDFHALLRWSNPDLDHRVE